MNTSSETSELFAALSKAQAEVAPIAKSATVKDWRGQDMYQYATNADITEEARRILGKHRLLALHEIVDPIYDIERYEKPTKNGTRRLVSVVVTATCITRIAHESGQWLEFSHPIAADTDGMQAVGAVFSYARKYGLLDALNMATEDEDDRKRRESRQPKLSWGESQLKAATDKGYSADHLRLFIGGHPSHWTKDGHLGAFQYFVKRSKLGQVAAVLPSNSDPNRRYIIVDTGAGLSCDCEAGKHKKPCKHVDAFVASLERE